MKRFVAIAAVVAVSMGLAVGPAGADLDDDLDRVAREVAQLRSPVGSVRSERTEIANEVLDAGDRLEALTAELEAARQRVADTDWAIKVAELDIAELSGRIADRQDRIAELGADIEEIKGDAVARAVELYMQGQRPSTITIFDIEDAGKFAVRLAYATRVQEVSDHLIADLEALTVQAKREQDRLAAEQRQLRVDAEFLDFQRSEREADVALVESRAAEVAVEVAALEARMAELQHEVEHIEGEIAALAREEAAIKALIVQQQNSGGTRPGILLRPVPGGVSSGYGYRIHPIYGERRLHTGWDMNAGCGAPIRAAESGVVIYSGVKGGYGNTIIIDHGGGMSTLYAHQSRLGLAYGSSVGIGDTIGWIGNTGVSTSCHLHFEVRIDGSPVDPAPYL